MLKLQVCHEIKWHAIRTPYDIYFDNINRVMSRRKISLVLQFMSQQLHVSVYSCNVSGRISMYLSMYLSIYLCIYISIYVSMYLCMNVSIYLSIYLSLSFSLSLFFSPIKMSSLRIFSPMKIFLFCFVFLLRSFQFAPLAASWKKGLVLVQPNTPKGEIKRDIRDRPKARSI